MGGSLSVLVFSRGDSIFADAEYKSNSFKLDYMRIEALKKFLHDFAGPLTKVKIVSDGGYVPDNLIKGDKELEALLDQKVQQQGASPISFEIYCDNDESKSAVIDIVDYILNKSDQIHATIKIGENRFYRPAGVNGYVELPRNYDNLVYQRGSKMNK